jgi:hypothetical protein
MVRRGSTVRVRQRALQSPCKSGPFLPAPLAELPTCARYGAVYGALRFRTALSKSRNSRFSLPWTSASSARVAAEQDRVGVDAGHNTEGEVLPFAVAPQEAPSPANPKPTGLDEATLTAHQVSVSRRRAQLLCALEATPRRLCVSGRDCAGLTRPNDLRAEVTDGIGRGCPGRSAP